MDTLLQALQKLNMQQCDDIYRLWGMDVTDNASPSARNTLYLQRVKEPLAARFTWEHLSQEERLVLYRVLGHAERSGIERTTVQKKTQLSTEQFQAALDSLEQHLLIRESKVKQGMGQKVYYAPPKGSKNKAVVENVTFIMPYTESADALYTAGKEFFSSNSDRSTMPLDRILSTFYYGDLDELAKVYDISSYMYFGRSQLRALIEENIMTLEVAADIIQGLDKPAENLFQWLCQQGSTVSMDEVRKKTGFNDAQLFKVLQALENRALAFDTFSEQKRVLSIPHDIFDTLKLAAMQSRLNEKQGSQPFVPVETTPASVIPATSAFLYDLAIIIGNVYQQPIEPTQGGYVPKRIANKIRPLLHGRPRFSYYGEDDSYLDMVFHIATDLGVLLLTERTLEGTKPRYEPGPELPQWSRMDAAAQTKRLLEVWPSCRVWSDIAGVHYKQWDPYGWNYQLARGVITKYLAQCVPNQWYTVSSLLNQIWEKDAFALRTTHYGARKADRTKTSELRTKWKLSEGETYIGILASSIWEMGLVELGYAQNPLTEDDRHTHNPTQFMLTDVGAAALTAQTPEQATDNLATLNNMNGLNGHSALVLQPNFELLLLHPDFPALYSVLPFAQVNQIDMVSRLTLTRVSALRGSESGVTIEQMLRTLEERSQKGVPQNVEYSLRDWVKSFKGVKVSQVLLLEVSAESVADELCASSKFKSYGFQRLGPTTLAVSNTTNLSNLRSALEKETIFVKLSGEVFSRQKNSYY